MPASPLPPEDLEGAEAERPERAARSADLARSVDVSVVIGAYNSMPYITATMDSVLAQTIGHDRMEVVVVDDGSTDGTGEELDRYAAEHAGVVTVFHQPNSGGPSAPRNLAMDHAVGRYVFVLDADDQLGTEALERMVAVADENGTDVVLGKLVGVNGRRPPGGMYKRNQPKTDVFSSRAYWTLDPLKLFRRSLIEDRGLRFPVKYRTGEDRFFTGIAMILANGISIIADYVCVYKVLRDDGGNICKNSPGYAWRTERQLDLVRQIMPLVPDQARLNMLLERHYRVEFDGLARMTARVSDPDEQREGFAHLRQYVEESWNPGLIDRLPAVTRLRAHLVRHGLMDELIELTRHPEGKKHGRQPVLLVENRRALSCLPYFRDPRLDIPDEVFDDTDRIRLQHRVHDVVAADGALHLAGVAWIRGLAQMADRVDLVLCRRKGLAELRFPATIVDSTGFDGDEDKGSHHYEKAGFEVTLAAGELLPGAWDAYLELQYDGLIRRTRVEADPERAGLADPVEARGSDGARALAAKVDWNTNGRLELVVRPVRKKTTRARKGTRPQRLASGSSKPVSAAATAAAGAAAGSGRAIRARLRGVLSRVRRLGTRIARQRRLRQ